MAQCFFIVLDDPFLSSLGQAERRLPAGVSNRTVGTKALLKHTHQHWDLTIDVIVDTDARLSGMQSVQPAGVLHERALPGDWHGQEKGIEPRIVEALADITAGRDDEALLVVWYSRELCRQLGTYLRSHAAAKQNQMSNKAAQPASEVIEMITPLG